MKKNSKRVYIIYYLILLPYTMKTICQGGFYFFIIPPPSLFLVHSVKSFPSDDVKENFSYGIFSMQ